MLTRIVKALGREWTVVQDDDARFIMPDELRQLLTLGSALKPAWEPIVLARRPFRGTVAANVLAHGTGALNIDGCRIDAEPVPVFSDKGERAANVFAGGTLHGSNRTGEYSTTGRWPANILHDGSEEVLAAFPDAPGQQGRITGNEPSGKTADIFGEFAERAPSTPRADGGGSAARFFYTAKASRHDRNEGLQDPGPQFKKGSTLRDAENVGAARRGNHHPTVKPTELMRYLCRLITPPGGLVLDPFMGSGSTLKAAELEGFRAIGIELSPEYIEIAKRRIAADAPLFAEVVA